MTGAERTLRSLNFEPVDRAPIAGGMIANGPYLAGVAGEQDFWSDPRRIAFEAFRRMGCDAVLGPVIPKPPEKTTTDAHGRPTSFALVDTHPELTTPEQVAEYAESVASPDDLRREFDFQQAYGEYRDLMVGGQEEAGDMLLIPHCLGHAPHFPTSDGHFSYIAFLMACALHPDRMAHLFDHWGERARLRFEAVAQATVDHGLLPLIWIGQDLCDAKGPMLSPTLMDRLYFRVLRRAIEPLKQAGMRIVWHTDANYRLLVPYLLDLGIDGFQGLYETEDGIRLEELARVRTKAGQPPVIFGSVSTVWVLPLHGPDDVRAEVQRCIQAVGTQGGLLLAPSSSIGPEVAPGNIDAMYEHDNKPSP